MKQPSPTQPAATPPPQAPADSIDTATLELLATWKAEDATTDAQKIEAAEAELAEFKRAMNASRAATGGHSLFR